MKEHTFWKAMPCVFDWIRENRMVETQFRTMISEAIENDGFQFTSMEEALILYKKATSSSLQHIIWEENYYDANMLMSSIKEYIFDKVKYKVKYKVKSEMKTKIGSFDSFDSLKKLDLDVLKEYLTEMLEFTPYSHNTNNFDTLHCRTIGHEVYIESETIDELDELDELDEIDLHNLHNHFNDRTGEWEWCGFQQTYNADMFFRRLAIVAEAKRREILEKKFK